MVLNQYRFMLRSVFSDKFLHRFQQIGADKNTRFQYKLINKGGQASKFENAIEWLALSGIVTRIYQVEQAANPREDCRNIDSFKTYVSDVGLLCAKKDVVAEDILYLSDELDDFKGGMTKTTRATS